MNFSDEQLQQLYRYGISLSKDETQAYDLLQDALESFLKKPPTHTITTLAYIRRIMRNKYIDQCRHKNRFPEESFDELEGTISIGTRLLEDVLITRQQLDIVWQQLTHIEREIMFLWAVESMSAREISTELDIPRGSILSKIYRLRNRISANNETIVEGAS